MRVLTFFLRAGAVVVVLAALFSYLDDGSQRQAAERQQPPTPPPASRQTTPPRPKPAIQPGTVTIAAVGDVLMGTKPTLPPDGGASLFEEVSFELSADAVLGNLEGTLSTGAGSRCGEASASCRAFQTPPSYARRLREAGFTVLSLANDHTYDFGKDGLEQTANALDAEGLLYTGRRGEIALQRVGAMTIAIVGFAPDEWAQSLIDLDGARELVREAERRADVVIASMHAGAEGPLSTRVPRTTEYYLGENRGNARAFAHAVVDAGADLVVGQGPRVLRGMEWYRGRLIAYSLGTFARYGQTELGGGPMSVSGVLRVTLRGDGRFETGILVPLRLTADGTPALDPSKRAHGAVRALSQADFGDRGVRVSRSGALS
jgi:poly-gamma-glutamate capsule biosynthesis protein CapA/YwtB (metallophosphatase superfamily)